MVDQPSLSVATQIDNGGSSLAIMQADMDKAIEQKQNDTAPDSESDLLLNEIDKSGNKELDPVQISRLIEMAWEDRTPFSAIEHSFGLSESDVIDLMRKELKPSSFRLWRQRVTGRDTKHQAKRGFEVGRAYCKTQYKPR